MPVKFRPAGTVSDRKKSRKEIEAKRASGDHVKAKKLQEEARQKRRDNRVSRLFEQGYEKSGLPKLLEKKEKGRREAAQQAQAERDTQEAAAEARAKGEKIDRYRKYLSKTQTNLINVPSKLHKIGEGFTLDDSLATKLNDLNSLPGFETLDLEGLQQRQKVLAGLLDELKKQVGDFSSQKNSISDKSGSDISWATVNAIRWTHDLPLNLNQTAKSMYSGIAPES